MGWWCEKCSVAVLSGGAHCPKCGRGRLQKDLCHECNLRRGGVVPKHGHNGITVSAGICDDCGENTTIVPSCDYDWPKQGKKAIWD